MNRISCFLLRCSLLIGVLFGTSTCRTSSWFIDKYNVTGVYRAEVSDFGENNYKPIESEKFIEAIKTSKPGLAKYLPSKVVMLLNAEGDSTKLVFSKDNKYFHISEIGYFELSNKNAKIVSELFEKADLTTSIATDDKDESSDNYEGERYPVDIPKEILQWEKEHRVSDEVIELRIQSALKDSSRLKALSYDEMTVDACLLREGKPTDMYEYGDTTQLYYYVPYGSYYFIFVNNTLIYTIEE